MFIYTIDIFMYKYLHNPVRKFLYILIVLGLSISCKKQKLTNGGDGWSIKEIIVNDLDYTVTYRNIVSNEVIYFRKDNTYKESLWYVQTGANQIDGTWEFKDNRKKLEIVKEGGYTELWNVEELKSKKMKLIRTDAATGWTYEVEYEKD